MNLKKCKTCGQIVPEGNYCDQCGALFATETAQAPAEANPATPVAPPEPISVYPPPPPADGDEKITDSGSVVATVIRLNQVKGGKARLVLKPDTIIGRTQGPYAAQLASMRYISSRHASVAHDGRGWWITDLGSTNGTYVNDDRLEKNVPHQFGPGDIVDLGTMIFEVV